jgi:hypothetical protein
MNTFRLTSAFDRFATVVVYALMLAALPIGAAMFIAPSL